MPPLLPALKGVSSFFFAWGRVKDPGLDVRKRHTEQLSTESPPSSALPQPPPASSFNASPHEQQENTTHDSSSLLAAGCTQPVWAPAICVCKGKSSLLALHIWLSTTSSTFSLRQSPPAFPFLPPLCIQDKQPSDHLQWQPQRVTWALELWLEQMRELN